MSEGESPWLGAVSVAAVVTTIAQFLAGSLVCKKFINKGTTGETSGFQFVVGILSCSLWLRYGWLKNDDSIVVVNTTGTILMLAYALIYLQYSPKRTIFIYQFSITMITIATIYLYTMYASDKKLSLERMGFIACFVTILFIGAPLTMLAHVIRAKSTETLPFPIIFMSFIVSGLWYTYGVMIDDGFVEVPNAVGVILALIQLCLFLIFPNSSVPPTYKKLNEVVL